MSETKENRLCHCTKVFDEKRKPAVIVVTIDGDSQTHMEIIRDPKINFHVTKQGVIEDPDNVPINMSNDDGLNPLWRPFVKKEDVEPVEVSDKNLLKFLGDHALDNYNFVDFDGEEFDLERYIAGAKSLKPWEKKRVLSKLHLLPFYHGSTTDIVDAQYSNYMNPVEIDGRKFVSNEPTQGWYDIEVDVRQYRKFPDEKIAPCPINAISYIYKDPNSNDVTVYGLFGPGVEDNPQLEEMYFDDAREECIAKLDTWLDENAPILKKLGINIKTEIEMYECEEDIIYRFFDLVHADKPAFMNAFNHSFDIQTIINRLEILGLDAGDVMCHPDIPAEYANVYFMQDERAGKLLLRRDQWCIPGYSHWTCQLIGYLRKRKTGKTPNQKLAQILVDEKIGITKLEYPCAIADLPYYDYGLFMRYSLVDTISIMCLELVIQDTVGCHTRSISNRVRFERAHSQSVSIEGDWRKRLLVNPNIEYILSNNINRISPSQDAGGIRGALVCPPDKILPVGEDLFNLGIHSNRAFKDVCDFDFKALYPFITAMFKIDFLNFHCKITFAEDQETADELQMRTEETPKGETESVKLINAVVADDLNLVGKRYFNLPSVTDLAAKLPQ